MLRTLILLLSIQWHFCSDRTPREGQGALSASRYVATYRRMWEFYNSTDGVYPTPSLSEVFDNTAILFLTLSSYVR